MKARVTEQLFHRVKKDWFTTNLKKSQKYEVSLKTILQIRGSKDYYEYRENVMAQHPEEHQFSIKEAVMNAHWLMFRKDDSYLPPLTGRRAIIEIQLKLVNDKKKG